MKNRICICGGGGLGHVVGGWLASHGCQVNILTRRADEWSGSLTITDPAGKVFDGKLNRVTSDPQYAVENADIVLLCLPGYAIAKELELIRPYLPESAVVGSIVSSTGFFLMAQSILPATTRLFGFQRVPFIARIDHYGHSANLLGYKSSLAVATLHATVDEAKGIQSLCGLLFQLPVTLLDSYLEATLTNSNPLLHPCRLYGLFGRDSVDHIYDRQLLFYEDWDLFSSEILIACDEEFQQIIAKLSIPADAIPPLTTYYESPDAEALTRKISSINAFKGLAAPMKHIDAKGFVPDYTNRYFTEDIPFGMILVKCFAEKTDTPTPNIDRVLCWAQRVMNKEYITSGRLCGSDIAETIAQYA